MKRLYWFVNKPWESIPILLRAKRFRKVNRRLNESTHIQWAHELRWR